MTIEQSRATGLSAVAWDFGSMWSSGRNFPVDWARTSSGGSWISRSAQLQAYSSSFDRAVSELHQAVAAHHGYLEDLRTESRSRQGRTLSVAISVPSTEFDAALADLKGIGRTETISEAGQDSAVKLASEARHLAGAQANLVRLQKLQHDRKGELRDALAVEKEIAQASEAVSEAQRQHEASLSTVAQAHIAFTLMEDYRAPLQTNLFGELLRLRNSLVEGISAIFSSTALVVGVVFEYGLPLLFWMALLFWPSRLVWRRFHRHTGIASVATD